MMKSRLLSLVVMLVVTAGAAAQKLDYSQKQAVDRQKGNRTEAAKKLESFLQSYEKEKAELADKVVPPNYFKTLLANLADIEKKCDAITADLEKSKVPADHPDAKPLVDFAAETKGRCETIRSEITPKFEEAQKVADPKNYPNLDADFEQMEELVKSYRLTDFLSNPDRVKDMVERFPTVTQWCSDRFAQYRPLIIVTGGKESPLYKRYGKTAEAIKGFQDRVVKFFDEAKTQIPSELDQAEKMGNQAAKDKKPAFFTGGVRQHLDKAEAYMKVCRGFLKAEDERLVALETSFSEAKVRIAAIEASLETEITAATRAPDEKYQGSDRAALESELRAAWKKAWPDDEILAVRFHMQDFNRSVEWNWVGDGWKKSDTSVLCVTVIVKTSSTEATQYPAYVNLDNLSNSKKIGVDTKGSAYVQRKMLVANL